MFACTKTVIAVSRVRLVFRLCHCVDKRRGPRRVRWWCSGVAKVLRIGKWALRYHGA